jgi:hypothetical protein
MVTHQKARRSNRAPGPLILHRAISSQKLGEREGAMVPRWNQVVLPVGREQDCVNAGVGIVKLMP